MKKIKQKTNGWKVATIILLVIAFGLISFNLYTDNKVVKLEGFQMPEKTFNQIVSLADEQNWNGIYITNLENKETVQLLSTGK